MPVCDTAGSLLYSNKITHSSFALVALRLQIMPAPCRLPQTGKRDGGSLDTSHTDSWDKSHFGLLLCPELWCSPLWHCSAAASHSSPLLLSAASGQLASRNKSLKQPSQKLDHVLKGETVNQAELCQLRKGLSHITWNGSSYLFQRVSSQLCAHLGY